MSTDLHQFLLKYHRVCLNVWPFVFSNSRFISIFSYRLNTDQPNYLAILTIHSFGYGCILIFALAVFFPAVYDPEQNHIWADLWYSSRETLLYISIYSVFQFPYEQVGCRPLKRLAGQTRGPLETLGCVWYSQLSLRNPLVFATSAMGSQSRR